MPNLQFLYQDFGDILLLSSTTFYLEQCQYLQVYGRKKFVRFVIRESGTCIYIYGYGGEN